jgi:uncharacterized protein YjiS (DUF1127 family)
MPIDKSLRVLPSHRATSVALNQPGGIEQVWPRLNSADRCRRSRLKLERLKENLKAADIALTPDDLREIESSAPKITVQGARYPEHLQQLVAR